MFHLTVSMSGSLLNGRAQRAVRDALDDAQREVAAQASADVHMYMNQFFKEPTPYYETQVITERQNDDWVVHDSGVIYGPWLNGTGSRNFPVTRFKGYPHWRWATRDTARRVRALVEPIVRRHLGKL